MSNLFLDLTYQVLSHGGPITAGLLLEEPSQGALHVPRKQDSLLSDFTPGPGTITFMFVVRAFI